MVQPVCPRCGAALPPQPVPSCPLCGLAFGPPSGQGAPPPPGSGATPPPGPGAPPPAGGPGSKRRTGWIAALAVALVVVVVAAVVAVVVTTGDDEDSAGDDSSSETGDATSETSGTSGTSSETATDPTSDPATGPGPGGEPVNFVAPSGWEDNDAVVELWKAMLLQQGYQVKTTELEFDVAFPALAAGEVDVFLSTWLPSDSKKLAQIKNQAEDLGGWYDGAGTTIVVPKYLTKVNTIADLRKVAGDLDRTISGQDPAGPVNKKVRKQVLPGYGLDGWSVEPRAGQTMLTELEQAIKDRKPIAGVLWRPHWAYHGLKVKSLRDPQGLLGKPQQIHAIARSGFSSDHPEVASAMRRFHLSSQEYSELQWLVVRKHQNDPEAGAREWLRNHPGFAASIGLR